MFITLKKIVMLLFVSMIVSSSAFAGTQKLAYILNDEDTDIIDLIVNTDKNHDITSIKMIYKRKSGKVYKSENYAADKVLNGIVLYEKKGREIVKLQSRNFSSYNGGDVTLNYLVSGISGKRANKYFDLSRNGDNWLLKVNRKKIRMMHFKSNKKPLVGTIGIKSIITK